MKEYLFLEEEIKLEKGVNYHPKSIAYKDNIKYNDFARSESLNEMLENLDELSYHFYETKNKSSLKNRLKWFYNCENSSTVKLYNTPKDIERLGKSKYCAVFFPLSVGFAYILSYAIPEIWAGIIGTFFASLLAGKTQRLTIESGQSDETREKIYLNKDFKKNYIKLLTTL